MSCSLTNIQTIYSYSKRARSNLAEKLFYALKALLNDAPVGVFLISEMLFSFSFFVNLYTGDVNIKIPFREALRRRFIVYQLKKRQSRDTVP
jgi:hypothetical protein